MCLQVLSVYLVSSHKCTQNKDVFIEVTSYGITQEIRFPVGAQ